MYNLSGLFIHDETTVLTGPVNFSNCFGTNEQKEEKIMEHYR